MAYLISCSGSKAQTLNNISSNIHSLSFNNTLGNARLNLLALNPQIEVDINWEKTLPAWQLYRGKRSPLYKKVTIENWSKPCLEIKILSALFGWIKHTDLLPYYDLQMKDKIPNTNRTIHSYWFEQGLLGQLVKKDDIDLMFQTYRRAIHGNTNPVADTPNIIWNDNYGSYRGVWLNEKLENIVCN
jgi:cytoplasmic iron level regulating protein YaaA (DUF328/UPF0246 family)